MMNRWFTDSSTVRSFCDTGGHPRRGVAVLLAAVVLTCAGCWGAPAVAQETPGTSGGEQSAETTAGETEEGAADSDDAEAPPAARETSIHGGWLVIATYLLFWGAIAAFIVYLGARQRRLAGKIDSLETRIDETLTGLEEE